MIYSGEKRNSWFGVIYPVNNAFGTENQAVASPRKNVPDLAVSNEPPWLSSDDVSKFDKNPCFGAHRALLTVN